MTTVLTACALAAFAANSLLCRMALGASAIDPASFTLIRLASGAAFLLALSAATSRRPSSQPQPWRSAVALFGYAFSFSWAYQNLSTGTGALLLFGAVQTTMVLVGLATGERPARREWIGLVVAIGGLVYLVMPGLTAPPLAGSALMSMSGICWGLYSLWGRHAADPLYETRINFTRALPLAIVTSVVMLDGAEISMTGATLGVLSGAFASGLGYVLWYAALKGLSATRAATVQLSVPVLAALGGVVVLDEAVSRRLVVSALLILGGVAVASIARTRG